MLPALCLALATRLAADGVARVDGVLPAALAADVRAVALAAAVGAPRQEVPLSLKSDAVASAAAAVAASPVGSALEDLCGGDAPLFDLCAVVSAPGAPIQPLHSDLGFDGGVPAPLYTCFVTLQDTPAALGPTDGPSRQIVAPSRNGLTFGESSPQPCPRALARSSVLDF